MHFQADLWFHQVGGHQSEPMDSTHFACEFTLLRRELTLNRRNLKQNERPPSAYAGSTNKGDNEHSKDVIFTRHASKCKAHNATRSICEERYAQSDDAPLVEFMYIVCTRMPDESCRRGQVFSCCV